MHTLLIISDPLLEILLFRSDRINKSKDRKADIQHNIVTKHRRIHRLDNILKIGFHKIIYLVSTALRKEILYDLRCHLRILYLGNLCIVESSDVILQRLLCEKMLVRIDKPVRRILPDSVITVRQKA